MDEDGGKMALALAHAQSRLDDQFARVNQIQGTLGVMLGFVATSIGIIFASPVSIRPDGTLVQTASLALLLFAGGVFGFGLALFRLYRDPEDLESTLGLNNSKINVDQARERLTRRYLTYYRRNQEVLRRRFLLVNVGIAALLLGIAIYAGARLAS